MTGYRCVQRSETYTVPKLDRLRPGQKLQLCLTNRYISRVNRSSLVEVCNLLVNRVSLHVNSDFHVSKR